MTPDALLAAFHAQVRLRDADGSVDNVLEHVGLVRRNYSADPHTGWAMIESPEGLGADPDAAIAAQRDFFEERGQRVEWKTYSYDDPADLGARLSAAGFVKEDDEALLLGSLADLVSRAPLPTGVSLRTVTGADDFRRIQDLGELIWGPGHWVPDRADEEEAGTPPGPPAEVMIVAEESPEGPVLCAARVTLVPGTDFAGMWGGNTHPDWRRRGLYRALLATRSAWAIEQGYSLARVDASPDSEPILRRLGLHRVATTVPYVFDPSRGRTDAGVA